MEDQDPVEAAADAIIDAGGLVSITNLKAFDEDSVDDVEINYAGELTPSLSEWIARVMAPFPLKYRLVPESAYPDPVVEYRDDGTAWHIDHNGEARRIPPLDR
jgi:hypothetical protein